MHQEVDLLDANGALLLQPGVVAALQNLIVSGCRVRVICGGLTPGQSWTTELQQLGLRSLETLKARHVVLRVDDTMLLALPLDDGNTAPLFALNRPQSVDVFDRFASDMDRHWDTATPITQDVTSAPPAKPDTDPALGEPPRRWPRQPN